VPLSAVAPLGSASKGEKQEVENKTFSMHDKKGSEIFEDLTQNKTHGSPGGA